MTKNRTHMHGQYATFDQLKDDKKDYSLELVSEHFRTFNLFWLMFICTCITFVHHNVKTRFDTR